MARMPDEISVPEHDLTLRRWRASDLDCLHDAVGRSLAELRLWMPWAAQTTLESRRDFLVRSGAETGSDVEMGFGLWEAGGELVGGFGLHARSGPGILEIGYWVRSDRTGRGYATTASRALTAAAFDAFAEVDRVEIRCDPANLASAAIPAKLGYRLDGTVPAEIEAAAQTGTQQVWVMVRAAWPQP